MDPGGGGTDGGGGNGGCEGTGPWGGVWSTHLVMVALRGAEEEVVCCSCWKETLLLVPLQGLADERHQAGGRDHVDLLRLRPGCPWGRGEEGKGSGLGGRWEDRGASV